MIFYAKDFGMTPDTEIGSKLTKTLCEMAQTDGEKTLVFEKGVYHIDIGNCEEKTLYITNTVGDNEFSDGEAPHKRHMLIEKLREYLREICADEELTTSILKIGDGAAVSVKR